MILVSPQTQGYACAPELLSDSSKEIQSRIREYNNTLIEKIDTNQEVLSRKVSDVNDSFCKVISDESNRIEEVLSSTKNLIQAEFSNQNEVIDGFTDNTKEQFCDLSKKIGSENKETRVALSNSTDSLRQIIHSISQQARDIVNDSFTNLKEFSSNSTDQIQKQIGQANTTIQDVLREKSAEIIFQTTSIGETLTLTGSEIKEHIASNSDKVSRQVESVMQQGLSIQERINSSSSDIVRKAESLNEMIQDVLREKSTEIISQTTSIGETLTLTGSEIKEHIASNSDKVSQQVESVIQQGLSIQERINSSSSDIVRKAESINEMLNSRGDEMKKQLSESEKRTVQLINEGLDNLSTSITSIDTQTSHISSLIEDSMKNSDKQTEEFMEGIDGQYQAINKELAFLQIKTNNIEETVNILSQNETNEKIVDSIKFYMNDLQSEFKNALFEFNNQLIDAKLSQETTNNEIENLQVLLRTILKSLKENSSNTSSVSPQASKQRKQDSIRTDTIVDDETKNIVVNQYKDDIIVKSTMKDAKGHTLYELEYANGKILRSRNFDKKGNVNVEQSFYDNGQVHYRYELTSKGKVITEFDKNGKRK